MIDADAFIVLIPWTDIIVLFNADDAIVAAAGFAITMAAIAIRLGRREEDPDD